MQMTPPLCQKAKRKLKSFLMRVKEESERAGLKLNIKKLRSWPLVPSFHGKKKRKVKSNDRFLLLGL